MGKIIETKINTFDGGIVNDPRDRRENTARIVTNSDIFTNPHKITPHRDSEDGDTGASTSQKQNFAIARRTGTTYELYALGVQSGASDAEVLYKSLSTGGVNDLDDAAWTTPSNNQQGTGVNVSFDCFVYYQNQDEIYSIRDSQFIQAFSPTGSAWIDSEADLGSGINNVAEGLVHSKDDICYIPYDNKIASKNGSAAWTTVAVTLPTHLHITSIAEYGNFLAIGAAPLSGIGKSVVYLWDRNATLATLSESIDWGYGNLKILEEIDGVLMGISILGGVSSQFNDQIIFREYRGVEPRIIKKLVADNTSTILPIAKQKVNDRLYFMLRVDLFGALREGVWSIGRNPRTFEFTVAHEYNLDNDTSHSSGVLKNFILVGDFMFQSYDDGGFALTKTNDSATYTGTSIYESKIFNTVDSSLKKDLLGITVTTEALPTAGQIVLEYLTDENIGGTSWNNIFTETTDNSISFSAVNSLPKDYKEIQFRIESTGGAEPTGLFFKEEVTGKRNYE